MLSESVIRPDPLSSTMFPVVAPPIVRVCALVVERLPLPVRNVALLPWFADIDAVGVPEPTLINAILALAVDSHPSIKSCIDATFG